VVPDLKGRSFGRGAWVHPRPQCLKRLQQALQKSFKAPVTTTTPQALWLLHSAAETHVNRILGDARRQGLLIYGSDQTGADWLAGRVQLVLIARDARAAAQLSFVEDATRAGKVQVWATKAELGALFGRAEIGVLGVRDRGLAQRLFGAIAMALLVRQAPDGVMSFGKDSVVLGEVE
jgi:ribosomal protein L7Ae-like RNA K-turn-binding protein